MSGNVPGSWDEHEHFTPGKAVTHTMGHYPENGPPFCQECTDAWKNWVTWPCAGVVINKPKLRYRCVNYQFKTVKYATLDDIHTHIEEYHQ